MTVAPPTRPVGETWPLAKGETLSDHEWWPFHGHRFLGSEFVTERLMKGERAALATAVVLWAEAMRQDPAGTLPVSDLQLAALARFATIKDWLEVKDAALGGFALVVVEDGADEIQRYGHDMLRELAVEMIKRKRGRRTAREAQNLATRKSRIRGVIRHIGARAAWAEDDRIVAGVEAHIAAIGLTISAENVRLALAEVLGIELSVVPFPGAAKGRPQG